MIRLNGVSIILSFAVACVCVQAAAQGMDVDEADSLNFEAFHKDKKDAIKIWNDKDDGVQFGTKSKTVKAYDSKPAGNGAAMQSQPVGTGGTQPATARQAADVPKGVSGQRYEIRERYTLGRSTQTPYSAFFVIEALDKQMAQICAKGWRKVGERSEPIEGDDFYMYYQFVCL